MQRDHIFPRGRVYWCRFSYADYPELQEKYGLKDRKFSLRTKDKTEAYARAAPHIATHKLDLLEVQNRRARRSRIAGREWIYPLGLTQLPDGGKIMANTYDVLIVTRDGKVTQTTNAVVLIPTSRFDPAVPEEIEVDPNSPGAHIVPKGMNVIVRRKVAGTDGDARLIDVWVETNGVKVREATEARNTLAIFKEITAGKRIADADRDDGRKLAKHLLGIGLKSRTVEKRVGYLSTATKIATAEKNPSIRFNPFVGVVPRINDAVRRLPLDDQDMHTLIPAVRAFADPVNGGEPEHELLFMWLATTGMRASEPFQIKEEFEEMGIRYVIVGSKTVQSERRVPIPDRMLPYLPGSALLKITKPLFEGDAETTKRKLHNYPRNLNRLMDKIGVTDPRKVVHSLRHRAKDVLRACECPEKMQHWILGHEEVTIPDGYGKGPPMAVVKPWLEKIGSVFDAIY